MTVVNARQRVNQGGFRTLDAAPTVDLDPPALTVLHAAVPGRLRVALPGLQYHADLARALERAALRLGGITLARANATTGTLLITHDAALTEPEARARIEEAWAIARGLRAAPEIAWWTLDTAATARHLDAPLTGLTAAEAARRRTRSGANVIAPPTESSLWPILRGQFTNFPTLLLCASAAVSFATGGLADALLIGGVVAVNATLGTLTEANAERIIGAFIRYEQTEAEVDRDNTPHTVAATDLVPGDVLLLTPGSVVPADARLIEAQDLTVDESMLTGESLPIAKTTDPIAARTAPPLAERTNMVFAGTMVVSGTARAMVVATGANTEIGQISAAIAGTERQQTPMQRQLDQLNAQLSGIGVLSAVAMFGIGLARGLGVAALARTAVALAVAAIPEGLTTVSTTVLASGLREMRRNDVLIRHLGAVETLGAVDAVCFDKTGTLTQNRMAAVAFTGEGDRRALLRVGVLCNDSDVTNGTHAHILNGSSTENALLLAAIDGGLDIEQLRRDHPLLSSDRRTERQRYMITRHADAARILVAVKGSPADVLDLCRAAAGAHGVAPLDEARRAAILAENERMAARGLRVLGFAHGCDESDLVWLGMIGLSDPLRPDMPDVIAAFHGAGIRTFMITGDQAATARAIAEDLHLAPDITVFDGGEPRTPEQWLQDSAAAQVFARISPIQKLNVVRGVQRAGHIVAMTGDGSNDGPALRAADIGVALGRNGTDLARDVADVVLANDDLQTMIVAVRQGRSISANIRKAVRFLVGTNGSEVMLALTATSLGLGQPMNAAQLLWINLLADIAVAYALGFEPPEADVMAAPPRPRDAPILDAREYRRLALKSGLYSASALTAHIYGLARHGGAGGGIAFSTLIGTQLLDGLSSRSTTTPFWRLPPNPTLQASLLGLLGLQAAVSLLPATRRMLGIAPLGWLDLAVIAAGSFGPFLAVELSKPGAASRRELTHDNPSPPASAGGEAG